MARGYCDRPRRTPQVGPVPPFGRLGPSHDDPRGAVLSLRPVLGLDLGGTQIRAAVVLPDGRCIARIAIDTGSADGPGAVVDRCIDALRASRDLAAAEIAEDVVAIGISTPGPVDSRRGVVVDPPNLGPAFRDVPLGPRVGAALGLPTALDRDTVVAALAEWSFGAAVDRTDFLYVTVSTGIGGAVVSDGRLLRGPDGTAGELGHVTVDADGPACGCGGVGHLEAVASGRALARDARDAATAGRSPFLAERLRSSSELTARDVAEGEEAGDAVCRNLMEVARRAFARACVTFADVFDPELIVVGGSITEHQGDRLLEPARRAVRAEAFRAPAARVRIVPAALGADVSLAGAQPLVATRLGADVSLAGAQPLVATRLGADEPVPVVPGPRGSATPTASDRAESALMRTDGRAAPANVVGGASIVPLLARVERLSWRTAAHRTIDPHANRPTSGA